RSQTLRKETAVPTKTVRLKLVSLDSVWMISVRLNSVRLVTVFVDTAVSGRFHLRGSEDVGLITSPELIRYYLKVLPLYGGTLVVPYHYPFLLVADTTLLAESSHKALHSAVNKQDKARLASRREDQMTEAEWGERGDMSRQPFPSFDESRPVDLAPKGASSDNRIVLLTMPMRKEFTRLC
ncbi:hypothetical protein FOZ62_004512, partial [Perkinsus olseni]